MLTTLLHNTKKEANREAKRIRDSYAKRLRPFTKVNSDPSTILLRASYLRCALRTQRVVPCVMASPNAFLHSPSRSARQSSHFFRSSSPDLPAIKDIFSRDSRRRPPYHSDKALVISSDEESVVKSAGKKQHFKSHPAEPDISVPNRDHATEVGDSSICIIDPPTAYGREVQGNHVVPPKFRAQSSSPAKDQPWKKFKLKPDDSKEKTPEARVTETEDTGPLSAQQTVVDPTSVAEVKSTRVENDINEPLGLEPAMVRRLDWTPPSNKTPAIPDSSSPAFEDLRSPGERRGAGESFEQILEAYKCADNRQQDVSMPLDEDASILRKRKLVELVVTTAAPERPSAEAKDKLPAKPPAKQRAPKKRPRTITELATAAYRAPDPLELVPVVSEEGTPALAAEKSDDPTTKGESKAKSRKKPSKAAAKRKKKPSPPPRPILLPPAEALQEVARQDFVFGTSSQLAIENSPTFLRDLQAAMRRSNQADYIDLDTPLNSDGIEPPERKRLWAAGARNVDGDLFDLEMNKLMDRSSQLLPALSGNDDPFGYIGEDKKAALSPTNTIGNNPTLQNDTHSKGAEPIDLIKDDSASFDSDVSTGSPLQRHSKPANRRQSLEAHSPRLNENIGQVQHHDGKPSFELFTDTQLSKEIASYGFKAIKSRQAKIALLEQCWQGKNHPEQPRSRRMVTTSAAPEENVSNSNVKTPRGRPRRNSASTPEMQEPPPSAQPPISPSKPRGRAKKTTGAAKRTTAATSKGKKGSAKASAESCTAQKRKPKSTKVIVEIPDSESDSDRGLSPDPASSPGSTFSPPPVDLSLSLVDDTYPSLSPNSTGDQSLSFEYITRAVKSAPRTTDPTNPSWHEKILLYDPIILEDLTTWLNCGQLTRVGFDGEVSTMEVKQWCESKSICCLWKVNLRGKERKRY